MLRIPLRQIVSQTIVTTITQSATFLTPIYDFDALVAKVTVGTFAGGGGTTSGLNIFIQTTDDGGTTWYDCVNIGTITTTLTNSAAFWATIPVVGDGPYLNTSAGDAQLLATNRGVPLLTPAFRIKHVFTNFTATGICTATIGLYVNNQSPKN